MSARRALRGQASVEFLYALPIILLLLLASLQFAYIYEAKQTLNYATFAGTRAGALYRATGSAPPSLMDTIRDGVTGGLAPLFTHGETQQALKDARATARTELSDSKLVRFEILNPTQTAYNSHKNRDGVIPNDNLMYRDPAAVGDMNIQDANLLKVRVTYCVRLVVPIVNRLIYSLAVSPAPTPPRAESYTSGAIGAAELLTVKTGSGASGLCIAPTDTYPYRLPVSAEAVVRMQAPFPDPGAWTAP